MLFKILFCLSLFTVLIYPNQVQIAIDDDSEFNSIINNYNDNYFYHLKEGLPVVPSQKFLITINGRATLKNVLFIENERIYLKNPEIKIGEDPLPFSVEPNNKAIIKEMKSNFPEQDFQIKVGYEKDKTLIYGYVSNYVYENNNIIKRKGILYIDYSVIENPALKSISKSILIIAPDSLKTSWEGYKSYYPDYEVSILSVDDIVSLTALEDTITKNIREYIKSQYQTNNLKGVILAGEDNYIPGIKILLYITSSLDSNDQIIITDKYYSCLDGDWNFDGDTLLGEMEDSIDIFPDVFLGRVPALNSQQVANFISKVAGFRNLLSDTFLGVASYLDPNTDGGFNIDNMIKLIPIISSVKKLYESLNNLSSLTFINALNKSPMFVSHDGHGTYYAIQTGTNYTFTTDLDNLTNVSPIFMYSLSCLSAAYDADCIAEHFLRSTGGGYYLGNSRYGWYTPYFSGFGTGDLYNLYFYSNIFNETKNPVDALNRVFNTFSYEISEVNDWRWQFFTLSYFGDPMVILNTQKTHSEFNLQKSVYKNGVFSMSIQVNDSAFAELRSDTVIAGKTLYPNDNIFSTRIDNSDSLMLHITMPDICDFDTVIYTANDKSKSVYIIGYSISNKSGDTISLSMNLITDSIGEYLIKPIDVIDTFTFILLDTLFNITTDTFNIDFDVITGNYPLNNTLLPVILGGDTVYIQYGRNLWENITLKAKPDKQNYQNSESGFFNVSIKNKFSLDDVKIIFEEDTLLLDIFPNLQMADYIQNFTIQSTDIKVPLQFNLIYGCQSFSKTYNLSANADLSYMDFEDSRDLEVDSSIAFFHKSTNRASSGIYSYFCGETTSPTYPPNYITGIYSDLFTFDTLSFIGFDAYVDIEAGMDYLIVYLYSDTLFVPVITLSGRNDSFKTYIFNASDYSLLSGLNTRLAFEFYSENDIYQYEGVYIDNVLLPGELNSTGTKEEYSKYYEKSIFANPTLNMKNSILFASGFSKNTAYSIYDLSGRKISHGILDKKINTIGLNIPNGKYFFCAGQRNEFVKTFYILK